ncbi:BTAD domain-containing putative transcriptional regulator [Phytohabitans flavus]|uniref:AfsR/SARP family transcriptional regulator n=1 Tax=Phytohabitans flavus TaxID=1076124 RepID=UPI00362BDCA6
MEFCVLGPLTVCRDGRQLPIGPAQRRRVLATLLCHPNQSVPATRLVDAVWGDDPPRTARKNLQVHVYHLRRTLGDADLIASGSTGYGLRAEPSTIDAWRFERLVDGGQDASRRGELRRADELLSAGLAMWRGSAFTDLDFAGAARREALRLEELRLVALEARNEVRLRTGRHHGLVADLLAMLAEHPFRERLVGQAMTALYRDGRQTEALAVFHRTRCALAEEVGVDPGEPLTNVYKAILAGDELAVAKGNG